MKMFEKLLGKVIIPLVTPFRSDETIDENLLGDFANMVIDRGYGDSLIIGGSTGEFASMSFEERKRILHVVKEAIGTRVPLVAGTGAASTAQTIELTREAERLGYDVAMVVAPYYLRPTQAEILAHYKKVASATKLPVLLYNIPLFTGVNIDPPTVKELASIPNVLGIKEEAGINPTQASDFVLVTPDTFTVFCGDDTMVIQVMSQGGKGVVSGGSAVVGKWVKMMIETYEVGDTQKSTEIQLALYKFFRSFNQNGRVNPIPLLRAAISMTWKDVGSPRLPLLPASEEEKIEIRKTLHNLNAIK